MIQGVAGFYVQQGQKTKHKGVLWGMYVRPQARKRGMGQKLVQTAIDHARQHVEIIQLSVVSDNEGACALYEQMGFVIYGVEKGALKYQGVYYDENLRTADIKNLYTKK